MGDKEGGLQFPGNTPPRLGGGGDASDLVADLTDMREQNKKMKDQLKDLRDQVKSLGHGGHRLKMPKIDSSTLSSHMFMTVLLAGGAGALAIGLAYSWLTRR